MAKKKLVSTQVVIDEEGYKVENLRTPGLVGKGSYGPRLESMKSTYLDVFGVETRPHKKGNDIVPLESRANPNYASLDRMTIQALPDNVVQALSGKGGAHIYGPDTRRLAANEILRRKRGRHHTENTYEDIEAEKKAKEKAKKEKEKAKEKAKKAKEKAKEKEKTKKAKEREKDKEYRDRKNKAQKELKERDKERKEERKRRNQEKQDEKARKKWESEQNPNPQDDEVPLEEIYKLFPEPEPEPEPDRPMEEPPEDFDWGDAFYEEPEPEPEPEPEVPPKFNPEDWTPEDSLEEAELKGNKINTLELDEDDDKWLKWMITCFDNDLNWYGFNGDDIIRLANEMVIEHQKEDNVKQPSTSGERWRYLGVGHGQNRPASRPAVLLGASYTFTEFFVERVKESKNMASFLRKVLRKYNRSGKFIKGQIKDSLYPIYERMQALTGGGFHLPSNQYDIIITDLHTERTTVEVILGMPDRLYQDVNPIVK